MDAEESGAASGHYGLYRMPEVPPMVECSKYQEYSDTTQVCQKEHWRTKTLTGTVKTVYFVYSIVLLIVLSNHNYYF